MNEARRYKVPKEGSQSRTQDVVSYTGILPSSHVWLCDPPTSHQRQRYGRGSLFSNVWFSGSSGLGSQGQPWSQVDWPFDASASHVLFHRFREDPASRQPSELLVLPGARRMSATGQVAPHKSNASTLPVARCSNTTHRIYQRLI